MLKYFITLPGAECLVAVDGKQMIGFILSEENSTLGHIVTLDVAETARWRKAAEPVIDSWIADMKAKGIDGKALAAYLAETRARVRAIASMND
jgi:hypothetical protein